MNEIHKLIQKFCSNGVEFKRLMKFLIRKMDIHHLNRIQIIGMEILVYHGSEWKTLEREETF